MTRIALAIVLVSGLLAAAASVARGATPLAAIVDAGKTYAGQEVTVIGTVAEPRLGNTGESVYTLTDQDRRISVFSHAAPPALGERIEVTAKVGWKEGDEEFTWPPILLESARHPAP